jgi:hypothetical protein
MTDAELTYIRQTAARGKPISAKRIQALLAEWEMAERDAAHLRNGIARALQYLPGRGEDAEELLSRLIKANKELIMWADELDDRQRKEIELARLYATKYAHGTDGHHRLLLIAKLAELLDRGSLLTPAEPSKELDLTKPLNPRRPPGMA